MMSNGTMTMQMSFYASASATILFEPWAVSTWQGMLGSCVAVFVMAVLYEGLKTLRLWLVEVALARATASESVVSLDSATTSDQDNLPITVAPPRCGCHWTRRRIQTAFHILQAFLHLIQVTLGYLLMLVAMTFNVYLFISIVIGAAIGYLLFSYRRPIVVDSNESCH